MCADDPDKVGAGVCGCGVPDEDTDGDSVLDCNEACDTDAAKLDPGVCGCGASDADGDGDGAADCVDHCEGPAIGCQSFGRPACPIGYLDVLDVGHYAAQYPDLKASLGNDVGALQNHFLTSGIDEGRDASAQFSARAYLARYPDLLTSFGSHNYRAALDHWIHQGIRECRYGGP